jgi:hypothetical protein
MVLLACGEKNVILLRTLRVLKFNMREQSLSKKVRDACRAFAQTLDRTDGAAQSSTLMPSRSLARSSA